MTPYIILHYFGEDVLDMLVPFAVASYLIVFVLATIHVTYYLWKNW